MGKKHKDFCIFILTHGRADNVSTYRLLKRANCTYPIYFIIDNEDKQIKQYQKNFGKENVIIFNKQEYFEKSDTFDNFNIKSAILYARNASYDIAKELGYNYFLQLDDDYTSCCYRINNKLTHPTHCFQVKNIDKILTLFLNYFKTIPAKSIAMSQGGDWIGGKDKFLTVVQRKTMNTFFCKTNNPIIFKGIFNDDVISYTTNQSRGDLYLNIPFTQITQQSSQKLKGGMTEVYHTFGTYVKSFYVLLGHPSSTIIKEMIVKHRRLHHAHNWDAIAPCIIRESHKKI